MTKREREKERERKKEYINKIVIKSRVIQMHVSFKFNKCPK